MDNTAVTLSIVCTLLVSVGPGWCDEPAPRARAIGLTVRDSVLYKDGKPFRAIGINVRDLADDVLDHGKAAKESFESIRWLGKKGVPFIRFWASYFNNRRKYLNDPHTYWRNMDLLVDACEQANVALAPTLFWDSWHVPWVFDEYRRDWSDDESETRRFMRRYTREFVTRYNDRPIVWLWEFSNENNLMWDLPNTMQFLPEDRHDDRNIVSYRVGREAIGAFASQVRRDDPLRPISSGCSRPRPCQYHLAMAADAEGDPWADDSFEQSVAAARWTAPDPVDLLSVHYYAPFSDYKPAHVRDAVNRYKRMADRLDKPLYIGEFGVLDKRGKIEEDFDDDLYRKRVRDLLDAIYRAKVPLAAYWVYAVKPWGFGMGAVNPKYDRFDYVVDLIGEYNEKIAADLVTQTASGGGE